MHLTILSQDLVKKKSLSASFVTVNAGHRGKKLKRRKGRQIFVSSKIVTVKKALA